MKVVNATLSPQRIRDGYTLTATNTGTNPGLTIVYRPATADQVGEFSADPRKYVVRARELVVKHVVEWNVAAADGETAAPVSEAVAKDLLYTALDWMANVITGYAGPQEAADAKNSPGPSGS